MSDPSKALIRAMGTITKFTRGLMLQTATVQAKQSGRTGGVSSTTWTTLFTSACRLKANTGNEQDGGVQIQTHGSYTLHLPLDSQVVKPEYQVVIDGRTYKVVWTLPVTPLSADRIVGLEETT